jgi:prolyl-tRNA editing enzyme YbaK/EbsC (Cys-tRNA(Pro) deacylase)
MTPTIEIHEELDRAGIDFDLIEHRRTETAGDEARAIGVPLDEVAKTIVVASGERFVRAVLPASTRLDLHKVRELLDDNRARLASEEELVIAYRCTSSAPSRRSACLPATGCSSTGGSQSATPSCSKQARTASLFG